MPQLKIRGIEEDKIISISKALVDDLQNIIECPRDYITIEIIHSTFISDGKVCNGYPYIEVGWFDRGLDVQDRVAKCITKFVHNMGYEGVDIIFSVFQKDKYYENGEHF